jgi:hypothetical protein
MHNRQRARKVREFAHFAIDAGGFTHISHFHGFGRGGAVFLVASRSIGRHPALKSLVLQSE